MSYEQNLAKCSRCDRRERSGVMGPYPCLLDGRDIIEHVKQGYCPLGKFNMGIGDYIARFASMIGARKLVGWWTRLTGKPCGCADRQKKLNGRWHGFHQWILEWKNI